jgi:hypothetical protein
MAIVDRLTLRSVFTLADGVTPLPLSALSHNPPCEAVVLVPLDQWLTHFPT